MLKRSTERQAFRSSVSRFSSKPNQTTVNEIQCGYYLPSLHFLRSPPKCNVRIIVSRAISFLLLNLGDEGWPPAVFPLSYPVVIYSFNKVIVFI